MMPIEDATSAYERWLAKHVALVSSDLSLKHTAMQKDGGAFLRATFYRWIQLWPAVCADLVTAPAVLAVGDLHVDNFGTWRDREGRLVWGINDFDEACFLPFTNDLVRLAVSARLAIKADRLRLSAKAASDALLTGYMEGLECGGQPFVLAERHGWLRDIATNKLRNPVKFWKRMQALPAVNEPVPDHVRQILNRWMPDPGLPYSLRHRVSGLGSLGRPRYVALAKWRGGRIAREAKALVPSASVWARGGQETTILYQSIVTAAVRCHDPFVELHGNWIVRRLSPYCSRIELAALPKKRDEGRLLYAMGWETANVHLGSRNRIRAVRRDLSKRKTDWLRLGSKAMTRVMLAEWKKWVDNRSAKDVRT
jgi:hypothetical protein